MPGLRIEVYENQQLVHAVECPGTVELGRQAEGEGGPYLTQQQGDRRRIVVARLDEVGVSRHYLLIEPLASGRARLTNLSGSMAVAFLDGSQLDRGAVREVDVPVFLVLGDRRVGIQPAGAAPPPPPGGPAARTETPSGPVLQLLESDEETPLNTLADATIPPGAALAAGRAHPAPPGEPQTETMIRWLQAAMDVLQSAANSSEFFDKAAAGLVDLVGLDSGQVLLFRDGTWRLQAYRTAFQDPLGDERRPSRYVLNRVLAEKRTFWQVPAGGGQMSLVGVSAVVAAPILDRAGAVLGALYGDRRARGFRAGLPPLRKLEALLVELLANGVAAGVARLEQEQAEQERQKKVLLYERELQIARQIQLNFLPESLPQLPGWELVAHFQPAWQGAGDFYDTFNLSAEHVVLIMADVCDKGVGSALFMALFRTLLRAFSMGSDLGANIRGGGSESARPASRRRASLFADLIALLAVEQTNQYVCSTHAEACMFVTLFLSVLNTATGELTYVNAGHESPTIIGPQGVKSRLGTTGPAVGIMPDAAFDLSKTRLERGDILLMHTDGVTDARDSAGGSYSTKRFLALLEGSAPSAGTLVERLVADLRSHIGSADQFDDITLLAVRWTPTG
jgi:sigma-B regulation protein RsbU (phosphoserine phosphatase)